MIDRLIEFLGEHREWAFWIALVFSVAENTAFLSLVIPSTAILVGIGALIATGGLDFMPIFTGAAIGAIIGSTFSWWLGLRYGDWMLSVWPLRKYPELVAQARQVFAKWGPLAIIIGHFFGGLRPVVFLMCGMSRMNFWWFSLFNVTGSIAWAYVVPKFGEVGGEIVGYIWRLFTGG
ncbi:MAG: DedA family protein [Cereibacter sphaeroides]|uniref:DedA family protein n=1 Tax=Cereibacter sphaeroides TaxID=1063 RepID=A0A2W5S6J4_CERSP|nr:MAG: DedA family protein [Cereibacter sphaeroides]